MTPEEIAEVRALLKMRAEVNKRLRELTKVDDVQMAVRQAQRAVSDDDARRRTPKRPGWNDPNIRHEDLGWRSVWTTARVGRQ